MEDGISIIIPIYNTNIEYLDQCIESVLSQSYENIEILLINDGSTDERIATYIQEFSKKNQRIKAISKKNSGVSDTRNIGISHATKKWIMFVDADDLITPKCCESLINISDGCDIVIGKINYLKNEKSYGDFSLNFHIKDIGNEKKEMVKSMYTAPGFKYHFIECPVAKIYNREYINKYEIKFPTEIKTSEDTIFNYQAFDNTSKIRYLNEIVYLYRINESSYTKAFNPNYIKDVTDSIKVLYTYNEKSEYMNLFYFYIFAQYRKSLLRYFFNINNNANDFENKKDFKRMLKINYLKEAMKNIKLSKLSKKDKLYALIFKTKSYWIAKMMCTYINKKIKRNERYGT